MPRKSEDIPFIRSNENAWILVVVGITMLVLVLLVSLLTKSTGTNIAMSTTTRIQAFSLLRMAGKFKKLTIYFAQETDKARPS